MLGDWMPFVLLFLGCNLLALCLGSYKRGRLSRSFTISGSLVGLSWIASSPILVFAGASSPLTYLVLFGATVGALGMARSSWREARYK